MFVKRVVLNTRHYLTQNSLDVSIAMLKRVQNVAPEANNQ